jgi:hypothetical protein
MVILMFFGLVHAQDDPRAILRTRLEPAGPVLVGQPVRLHVEVLVTTWLTRAPIFPDFEMGGALVVLPDERSRNLTERIDGQSWFGVSRSYLIYAQEPREYQIPPVEMAVLPGQAEAPVPLRFEQLSFRAQVPAEAQGLGYFIATNDLQIRQELDRDVKDLKVGDSLRRTITMFASQTFAMFLPPVEFEEIEGLAVYPDPPQIQDRSADRVGFQGGERIDSATYVIQEEGEYELAPFEIYWWDLSAGRMRKAGIPAVTFSAALNPAYVPEIPLPEEEGVEEVVPEEESWFDLARQKVGPLALVALILAVVVPLLHRLIGNIRIGMAERRNAYLKSEAAAFDLVKAAARKGDGGELIRSLYQWIDRFLPGDGITTLGSLSGKDSQLDEQLAAICTGRYSGRGNNKRVNSDLVKRLARLRVSMNRSDRLSSEIENRLPDLNPRKD